MPPDLLLTCPRCKKSYPADEAVEDSVIVTINYDTDEQRAVCARCREGG